MEINNLELFLYIIETFYGKKKRKKKRIVTSRKIK